MAAARSSDVQPESLEFHDPGGSRFGVWLSSAAVASILATCEQAGRRETGGILIGRYDAEGWMAEVLEATPKPRGSRSGWWWFTRSNRGLAKLLAERWAEGLHYLGEWHYHPGGSANPSDTDVNTMLRIAEDGDYRCAQPILVILGGSPTRVWDLSATVFPSGRRVPLVRR
jgi:proteasome lid subunit RPN8/RPN11